ncbi:hypothetical protein HMPREF9711_02085 [Myroides odoratimimus CCUG 3837]|uniref:hypothetical protein n=1 Tax=Myroides odoratimimus TaxID=76832 RepID=UPI000280A31C|nr:hypothetical protein [Myroides odoratimimus]EKB03900.1 hypothetical protein HMPREF9711_02085 [Myroides odoratimimus CCUG 3837]
MRADTEIELIEEAKLMFITLGEILDNIEFPRAVDLSYNYILNNTSKFKYSDHVTAGTLIRLLNKIGYLDLVERPACPKLVLIKQKGRDFLIK